jgi:hypothetical protein
MRFTQPLWLCGVDGFGESLRNKPITVAAVSVRGVGHVDAVLGAGQFQVADG